jgi:DNA polymerase (family 10)
MSDQTTNRTIATELGRLASLMEIAGENPFRTRAIRNGADVVVHLDRPLAPIAGDTEALTSIPGIGAGIAALITEIVETGTTRAITELQAKAPEGLIDILSIPGIGAKTAAKLYQLADVQGLDSLRSALETGKISDTKGLGPKLAEKLAAGLEALGRKTGRARLGYSLPIARALRERLLSQLESDVRLDLTGSLRRWEETTGDINFLTTASLEQIANVLRGDAQASDISIDHGAVHATHTSGLELVIITASAEIYGTRWIETTGPKAHLELLGDLPERSTEEQVYESLGFPWIAPEFRQGRDELERARKGQLDDIITIADIKGELHCHTVWSDGQGSIEAMATAARERGYAYLAISDHSHSLGVANGLTRERLQAQAREIAEVAGRLEFPLMRSSEVEVHRDGALDFDTDTLHALDVVIASTHSGLGRPRAELMERLDTALSGGRVDVLAHPSGRLIEAREPGDFDWPGVFAMASDRGIALEINADPARLDLKADHARQAIEAGCLLSINCDAHHPRGFELMEYGIAVARRGFVPRDRVINTWPLERLRAWLMAPDTRAGAS